MAGYSLQPFDGKTDFSIWQQKMKGILIQQKVFKAIDGKYAENISEEKKLENDEFAYSSIVLNLSDTVLRKVGKLESSKALWDKLEELFTEISLPNKLFLLEKFFRYKLDLSKNIDENLDDFTKLIQDIKLAGDKYIDEYSPIVLLNAIPESYSDVKAAIKYGRDSINLETVVNGLKSKELDLKVNKPSQNHYEINSVRVEQDSGTLILDIVVGAEVRLKPIEVSLDHERQTLEMTKLEIDDATIVEPKAIISKIAENLDVRIGIEIMMIKKKSVMCLLNQMVKSSLFMKQIL
ncbi:UNVERIFIED_CONTAM: hypothetical protein Sindi_1543200 [Sesamum indicum]